MSLYAWEKVFTILIFALSYVISVNVDFIRLVIFCLSIFTYTSLDNPVNCAKGGDNLVKPRHL